jgi:hypothetical protein
MQVLCCNPMIASTIFKIFFKMHKYVNLKLKRPPLHVHFLLPIFFPFLIMVSDHFCQYISQSRPRETKLWIMGFSKNSNIHSINILNVSC